MAASEIGNTAFKRTLSRFIEYKYNEKAWPGNQMFLRLNCPTRLETFSAVTVNNQNSINLLLLGG
jgi:hypothetical protein